MAFQDLGAKEVLSELPPVKKDATQLLDAGVAEAAGFYAVAYEWNGETVISYRGTDSKGELLGTNYPIAVNDD